MRRRPLVNSNPAFENSNKHTADPAFLSNPANLISSSSILNQKTESTMPIVALSSCRDRTSEFHNTIRSFQSRMTNNRPVSAVSKSSRDRDAINLKHQFMLMAKKIGKELTNTCIKLEKLTDLTKKQSLFDDRPKEIQELTYLIKEDLNSLNSEINQLQEFVRINQNQDGRNMQKHSSNVVYSLQSKLVNVSSNFKHVLEVRTENLKHQNERGEKYFSKNSFNSASLLAPPKLPGNTMGKSVLLVDEEKPASGQDTTLNLDLMQKQQFQKNLIINQEETFLRERANAMQTVEQTIIELGSMFQQLANIVKEQDESIQRIGTNIQDVDLNVSAAHSELLKYFQSVTSNRWLMIKIFFVLIVFFVVFIVVMT
ncbi:syntaxin-5 [Brachionus plicatilis]|uniref:Syntaxin-5 n=1 Tax=Brachionus plicatilis TaxID=10195 RepID=A0A3M7RHD9_BRAPC|nr:syntaxin-5 [Brachionus plicatilis]